MAKPPHDNKPPQNLDHGPYFTVTHVLFATLRLRSIDKRVTRPGSLELGLQALGSGLPGRIHQQQKLQIIRLPLQNVGCLMHCHGTLAHWMAGRENMASSLAIAA